MAEFPLTNTAQQVDDAIQAVVDAPNNSITSGGTELVTSGTIYTALQGINDSNLDPQFLVTESEGINSNDTDTQIPTCAAVKDLVENSTSDLPTLDSGFTELGTSSASGTASKDGFIIATANSGFNSPYYIGITVAGILFQCRDFDTLSGNSGTVTIPIANGETYSVSASGNTKKIYFKGFS